MRFDGSISTLLDGYKLSSALKDILPDDVIPYDKEEIAVDIEGDQIIFKGRKTEKMSIRRALGRRLYPGWSNKELDDATEKIRIRGTTSEYTFKFRADVTNAYAECTDTPLHSCVNDHFEDVGDFYDIITGHKKDPSQNHPFTDAPLQLVELWKGTDKIGRALLWSNVEGSENGFFLDRTYPPEGKKDVLVDGKIVREIYYDFARKNNWTYRLGVGYGDVKASNGKRLSVNLENFKNVEAVPYMDTFRWTTKDGIFNNYESSNFSTFNSTRGTRIIHKKPVLKKSINDFQNIIIDGKIDLEGLNKFDITSLLEESATHPELIYLLPQNCKRLFMEYNTLHLGGSNWDTSNVTNMNNMFSDCQKLKTLDVSKWNTSNVKNMNYMFLSCQNLETLDVSKWNTSNVTNMNGVFSYCQSLKNLEVSKWNTSNVIDMNSMFSDCRNIEALDVSEWNTSNVTNMNSMFSYYQSLKNLDVSKWDTSNVTDMNRMFYSSRMLKTLDVSKWNTSNVTRMDYMFYECQKLENLNVSQWDTSNVTDMNNMFYKCESLKTLDVSKWNTSNVIDMNYMFSKCQSLEMLTISNWNTSNVTNIGYGFYDCRNLKNLNISRWNLKSLKYYTSIFENSGILKETLQIWGNRLREYDWNNFI